MCDRHYESAKRRARESMARKRATRRAGKLCIWCPGNDPAPATPGSTACLPCRIRRRRIKLSDGGVNGGVNERRLAIAAATRKDSDGRTRYHGQSKRGQQPKWQLNLQDMRHVREDCDTFQQALRTLASPEAQRMHASDRSEVELAAAHVGARMTRRTGDILERLGHFQQRHGPRPGEAATADDDGTLSYKRVADAARVAAAARAGLYVYAPPLDVVSGRRETAKEPKPPDLEPLRAALAVRGLELAAEGAFYWLITEKRHGRRDGDEE